MAAILPEHQIDAGRDPLVKVSGAEIAAHRLEDRLRLAGWEKPPRRAVGDDVVDPFGFGEEDHHAVDLILSESPLGRIGGGPSVQRRNRYYDDFLPCLLMKIGDLLIERADRPRTEERCPVHDVRVASRCRPRGRAQPKSSCAWTPP